MNTLFNHPTYRYIVILLCFMILQGCAAIQVAEPHLRPQDGEVIRLFQGSASYIIKGALDGVPMSKIFLSPDSKLVMYGRPIADAWGWVTVKATSAYPEFESGNWANAKSFSDLVQCLKDNGWVELSAASLTAEIAGVAAEVAKMELVPIFVLVTPAWTMPDWLQPAEEIDS